MSVKKIINKIHVLLFFFFSFQLFATGLVYTAPVSVETSVNVSRDITAIPAREVTICNNFVELPLKCIKQVPVVRMFHLGLLWSSSVVPWSSMVIIQACHYVLV